jgi:hypothetical protein
MQNKKAKPQAVNLTSKQQLATAEQAYQALTT